MIDTLPVEETLKGDKSMLKRSISAAALVAFFIGAQAGLSQAADFPDIMGVWAGTYDAAFPVRHGRFANQKKAVEMELRVTKQDDNLFWAENRWRVEGLEEWVTEDATGTFDVFDPTSLGIVEASPNPGYGSTGYFEGRLKEGKLLLSYRGIGGGISFSVVLERK